MGNGVLIIVAVERGGEEERGRSKILEFFDQTRMIDWIGHAVLEFSLFVSVLFVLFQSSCTRKELSG